MTPINANESDEAMTFKDYYGVRLRLTWGSLEKDTVHKADFKSADPKLVHLVSNLGVANAGVLESHEVTV